MLCVFPFEPEILHAAGIGASFVGHPLAQAIPARVDASAARVRLGLSPEGPVFALLPGSRESELHYHTKLFLRAAARIRDKRPGIRFVLPAVPEMHDQLAKAVSESELRGIVDVLRGQSHLALAACDAALVASGTATLETALFGKPMVIAYRMNPLSWWLMRSKRLQPWVGLPNILCQEFVVPEFLQEDATPEVLAGAMLQWLQDPAHAHAVQVRFRGLHQTLHRDTASLSVNAIESLLGA